MVSLKSRQTGVDQLSWCRRSSLLTFHGWHRPWGTTLSCWLVTKHMFSLQYWVMETYIHTPLRQHHRKLLKAHWKDGGQGRRVTRKDEMPIMAAASSTSGMADAVGLDPVSRKFNWSTKLWDGWVLRSYFNGSTANVDRKLEERVEVGWKWMV